MQVKKSEKKILSTEHLWYKVKIEIFSLESDGWRDVHWLFVCYEGIGHPFLLLAQWHGGTQGTLLTDSAAGLK